MIKYLVKEISNVDKEIDDVYKLLLDKKYQFVIIKNNEKYYCLTKEKSMFVIDDIESFISSAKEDVYYKTIKEEVSEINEDDLNKYYAYIDKYKSKLTNNLYGDKYIFGSVAIKCDKGFITTIRGKEDLSDYAYVNYVDHDNKIVSVNDKKASLNAPLLSCLFENENVKYIVHINHEYDNSLVSYKYAFPGTLKDSKRDNSKSFNIENHGVFYLFDKEGEIIR